MFSSDLYKQIEILTLFASSKSAKDLNKNFPDIDQNKGYRDTIEYIKFLEKMGYLEYITFNPSIIRGFDYYDGLVFEVFDKNPENSRSIYGGGRYNGLASLFGSQSFPAVGCAPGNVTTKLFLEGWDIVPKFSTVPEYFVTIFSKELKEESIKVANKLRVEGKDVELSFAVGNLSKQISYARKKGIKYVVIVGEDEVKNGNYKIEKV